MVCIRVYKRAIIASRWHPSKALNNNVEQHMIDGPCVCHNRRRIFREEESLKRLFEISLQ